MTKDGDIIYRIPPLKYIHVLDLTTNVTRLQVGPKTFVKRDNEKVVKCFTDMVVIPPQSYCFIEHPVLKNKEGNVTTDRHGQVLLKFGDREVRFSQEPFPLYPGEILIDSVKPLDIVDSNFALTLSARVNFIDDEGIERKAGESWLRYGPCVYIPKVEEDVIERVPAVIVNPLEALSLKAIRDFTTRDGVHRRAGEEYLMRKAGAYIPEAYEEVIDVIQPVILTAKRALLLGAKRDFTDVYGIKRRVGHEWLVTANDADSHIVDVNEQQKGIRDIMTLSINQWCIIRDPRDRNTNKLGTRIVKRGPQSFFLQPGEKLEGAIHTSYNLDDNDALLLEAREFFIDGDVERNAGEKWILKGPIQYFPPVEVDVKETRSTIPLEDYEGIYVRDIRSGHVRLVKGKPYLLEANEELWEKYLDHAMARYSYLFYNPKQNQDKSSEIKKAPCYKIPTSSAMRLYDYKNKKSRTEFGPTLVVLNPNEEITMCSVSLQPGLFSRILFYWQLMLHLMVAMLFKK